jgi:ATP-dependent DNA ligase
MAATNSTIRDYRNEIPGELTLNGLNWAFPTVKSVNAHGKPTYWIVNVRAVPSTIGAAPLPDQLEQFLPLDRFLDNAPADVYGWTKVDSALEGAQPRMSDITLVKSGKNLTRANATNPVCQALRDALGLYNKQLKKAYSPRESRPGDSKKADTAKSTSVNTADDTDVENASSEDGVQSTTAFYPPMLAKVFNTLKRPPTIDAEHPAYLQRKYNGLRAVVCYDAASQRAVMYSRTCGLYADTVVCDELTPVLASYHERGVDVYLDGEMYAHGKPLQVISGVVRRIKTSNKKTTNTNGVIVDFMVYDLFIPAQIEMLYSERKRMLDELFAGRQFTRVKNVETFMVRSRDEIKEHYRQFLMEKYEGAMVRLDQPYVYSWNGRHVTALLKLKEKLDAEYPIIGWETGRKGKAAGALMIICAIVNSEFDPAMLPPTPLTNSDDSVDIPGVVAHFPVTPAMKLPERMTLAKKMAETESNSRTHFENSWYGREITIYYEELSMDGLPLRATTKLEMRYD